MLEQELWSEGAGLFAACFIAIVPGYISRSVAGSYDNEVRNPTGTIFLAEKSSVVDPK